MPLTAAPYPQKGAVRAVMPDAEGGTIMGLPLGNIALMLCFLVLLLAWAYFDLGQGHRA